jgi:hypothetical protein
MYGYNQISSALNTAKTDAYNGSLHHCALCKKPNRVTLHNNRYNLGNNNAFQIYFNFDTFLSPPCPRDSLHDETRVARWFVFKPKIPIWVNFGVVIFDIFYGHLVYFMVLWYT